MKSEDEDQDSICTTNSFQLNRILFYKQNTFVLVISGVNRSFQVKESKCVLSTLKTKLLMFSPRVLRIHCFNSLIIIRNVGLHFLFCLIKCSVLCIFVRNRKSIQLVNPPGFSDLEKVLMRSSVRNSKIVYYLHYRDIVNCTEQVFSLNLRR